MNPLVECIPNFSEGRRPEVVEAIVNSVRTVSGISVLDYSSDFDHNRSVLTFVGPPESMEAAAFEAIKTAAQLIDLDNHSGEHPRIGATDVVPFVQIRDIDMAECVAMARRVGQRVGEELSIPVYLYERAATAPSRENLATLRKGDYEGLKEAIKADPARVPDFGPSELGPAGATVIGARAPLIAYNVYLNTDDVNAAKKIGVAIRHSGGGLRYVKALGMLVDGQAQISMNLTDYTGTPIHRAQEMIRTEAARYGYQITKAELIGLIPEQALIDVARWYLQLDMFDANQQILEWQIQKAEASKLAPDAFISKVASGSPTPGGGSVAALAGALSASLAGMVARTTLGKKKYDDVAPAMQDVIVEAGTLQLALSQAIDADSAAFEAVMDAYRMDKESPQRAEAIQSAMTTAAEVPLETMRQTRDTLIQLKVVAELGNINAATDAAAGAHMARAAIEAAALNVRINLLDIQDKDLVSRLTEEVAGILTEGRDLADEVVQIATSRVGLS